MDNDKIQQLISDENNVIQIIDNLNSCFASLYLKYTIKKLEKLNKPIDYSRVYGHSAESFYMNGHCPSYARILCEIFGNYATKYDEEGHVFVKIGEHFYDVRGLVDHKISNKYHITDSYQGEGYIANTLGRKDEFEEPIEKDLIRIGKDELNRLYENSNSKQR